MTSSLQSSVPADELPFVCSFCDKRYKSSGSLKDHLNSKHYDIRPHACSYCDRSFTKASVLRVHISQHTGHRPFVCDLCHKSFSRKPNLKKHRLTHSGEKPFACTICNMHFKCKQNLTEHTRLHAGLRPWVCEQCGRRFTAKKSLQHHELTIHVVEKTHECDQCGGLFSQLSNLKVHMKIHSEKYRPFQCAQCGRRFKEAKRLHKHKKSHFVDRPYACVMCDKQFMSDAHLSNHMRIHLGVKPFSCRYCGKRFLRPSHRNSHAVKHRGVYECTVCDKRFNDSECFTKHLFFLHGITPDWGGDTFYDPSLDPSLSTTVDDDIEPVGVAIPTEGTTTIPRDVKERWKYNCHYCVRRFKHAEFLELHMTECPNRLLKPLLDPAQTIRYRIMNNVRAYVCNVCYKTLYQESGVTKHMLRMHNVSYLFNGDENYETADTTRSNLVTHTASNHDVNVVNIQTHRVNVVNIPIEQDKGIDVSLRYPCDKCDKRFATDSSARMHQLLHADSAEEFKVFACTECEMRFSWRSLLDKHLQRIHLLGARGVDAGGIPLTVFDRKRNIDVYPYVCMYCKETFEYIHQFYNHLSSVHLENSSLGTPACTVDRQTVNERQPGDWQPSDGQHDVEQPGDGQPVAVQPSLKRSRGRPPGSGRSRRRPSGNGRRSRGRPPGRKLSRARKLASGLSCGTVPGSGLSSGILTCSGQTREIQSNIVNSNRGSGTVVNTSKYNGTSSAKSTVNRVHAINKSWACSRCDQRFSNKTDLDQHELSHGRRKSTRSGILSPHNRRIGNNNNFSNLNLLYGHDRSISHSFNSNGRLSSSDHGREYEMRESIHSVSVPSTGELVDSFSDSLYYSTRDRVEKVKVEIETEDVLQY